MQIWEYATTKRNEDQLLTDADLNKMGEHGYELVNVLGITEEATVVGRLEKRNVVHYFFKRPKPATEAGVRQ